MSLLITQQKIKSLSRYNSQIYYSKSKWLKCRYLSLSLSPVAAKTNSVSAVLSWQLSLVREKEIRGRRRRDWMTRSPKMTGTRPRRNCGREPDIATASDTSPETVRLDVSVALSAVSVSACQYTYLSTHAAFN